MKKIFNYLIQSIFIYLFFLVGYILRIRISRKLFSNIFLLVGPLVKSKKIIKNNFNICAKKISNFDEDKITKDMWKNYGMTFIEYIFLSHFKYSNSHIDIRGEENLSQILNENKPVIFISGHFANFELMSMEITKRNIPLATIYRPLNNIFLNPLMEHLRKKYICKNQIKKGINGVRDAIKYIKRKHSIALMIDQRVSEGERVNFFDKPALTTTLPAQISTKYGIDIIPVYIERKKDHNFKLEFMKKISPVNFSNKIKLTEELNNILEKMIERNPGQWIWSHNRWK